MKIQLKQNSSDAGVSSYKEYIVLEISIRLNRETKYRIDDPRAPFTPFLVPAEHYNITSNKIPSNWVVTGYEFQEITLGPEAWSKFGFWDDYFNLDPIAKKTFIDEREIIIAGT